MVLEFTRGSQAVTVLGVQDVAVGLQVSAFHAQSDGSRELLAQLLVEADIACGDAFLDVVVACLFLEVLLAFEHVGIDAAQVLLADEGSAYGIVVAGHEAVAYLGRGEVAPSAAQHLVGVVVEIAGLAGLVLGGVLGAELQGVAPVAFHDGEGEVEARLPLVLHDVLVGVGELVQLPAIVIQVGQRTADVRTLATCVYDVIGVVQVAVFIGSVTLVGSLLRGAGVAARPVYLELAQVVLSVQGEVHGLLQFQSPVLVVAGACLGLHFHLLLAGIVVQVFVFQAKSVLPVAAAVVDALEGYLVQRIELVVQGQRVALPLAGDVVLPYFRLLQLQLPVVVLLILEFRVVGTSRSVLVGEGCHDTQLVVEEAVAPCGAQVPLRFLADPAVARSHVEAQHPVAGRVLRHQVDFSAYGVTVHVGGHHLVQLYGLYHVGGYQV